MAIKKIPGSPVFLEIPGVPADITTAPPKTPMASQPAPGAHGAQAPKPTHVMATERQGASVNPAFTNGGMTPNDFPYKQDWAVESGTHA